MKKNKQKTRFFSWIKGLFVKEKSSRLQIHGKLSDYEKEYRYEKLGEITLAYLETGSERKNVTCTLFLHGLTEDALNWFYSMEYILHHNKRSHLLALDLPGFGLTQIHQKDYHISIAGYAKLIKNFLAAKQIEKINLVGHSLGGQTAAVFTYLYPQMVEKLVLVDSAGIRRFSNLASGTLSNAIFRPMSLTENWLKKMSLMQWADLMMDKSLVGNERYFKKIMYKIAMEQKNSLTEIFIKRNFQKLGESSMDRINYIKQATMAMLEKDSYIDDKLPYIKVPVLLIWGEGDKLVPLRYGQRGLELIAHDNKELKVIKKSGHYSHLENPREFAKIIYKFIE